MEIESGFYNIVWGVTQLLRSKDKLKAIELETTDSHVKS